MVPKNIWEWLFAPLVIFVAVAFEMIAYIEPFVARWLVVFLLWKIWRLFREVGDS